MQQKRYKMAFSLFNRGLAWLTASTYSFLQRRTLSTTMAYPRNRFFMFQDPEYITCGCGNFYDDSPKQAEPRELACRGCKRLNMTSILEKYGTAISDVMKEIRTRKRRFQSARHAESRLRDYIRKVNDRMYEEALNLENIAQGLGSIRRTTSALIAMISGAKALC